MKSLEQKYANLQTILREMGSVVIGYSGGVDSTFLAKAATQVLGDKALSVAALSESYSQRERREAEEYARSLGLNYLTISTTEMDNPDYLKNAPNRCYHCKKDLLSHLRRVADEQGFQHIAVGTNLDDLGDFRPGQQAAREGGARSPLVEAELTKADIRLLSQQLGIPTWNKPAFACLASRIPYGEEISADKLAMVEQAEDILYAQGFRQYRVRHHKDLARIEVLPEDMAKLLELREEIHRQFKRIGYTYIALDLRGYRTGSLNESLFQISLESATAR